LTNMIVARFGERCHVVRRSQVFVKDEAEIVNRVGGVKRVVAYLGKLVFGSDNIILRTRSYVKHHHHTMCV